MKDIQLEHHQINFDKNSEFEITILLDQIDSPANLGSIFRNAEAFGVTTIWVHEENKKELESNRFKRTSRSTEKTLNINFYKDAKLLLNSFEGYKIGLEITSKSNAITELKKLKARNILIALGNEKSGISENILHLLDHIYHIQMFGKNSSLNVAQTLGIALYEIRRRL